MHAYNSIYGNRAGLAGLIVVCRKSKTCRSKVVCAENIQKRAGFMSVSVPKIENIMTPQPPRNPN